MHDRKIANAQYYRRKHPKLTPEQKIERRRAQREQYWVDRLCQQDNK